MVDVRIYTVLAISATLHIRKSVNWGLNLLMVLQKIMFMIASAQNDYKVILLCSSFQLVMLSGWGTLLYCLCSMSTWVEQSSQNSFKRPGSSSFFTCRHSLLNLQAGWSVVLFAIEELMWRSSPMMLDG